MRECGVVAVAVLACLLGPGPAARAQEAKPQETEIRATMHRIFDAIAVLLPLSLDVQRLSSAGERATIEASLTTLREASREVDVHAASRDAGFVGISQSLSRSIADARQSETVDLDLDGGLLLYLVVSVRVQRDLPRARATLTRFAARKDVLTYLARDLSAWLGQLKELAASQPTAPSLARARELSERGRNALQFAGDRKGLIYDLAASSELVRLLEAPPQPAPMLAEAYFMLGEITARVDRLAGVSETAQDLESSRYCFDVFTVMTGTVRGERRVPRRFL